MIRQKYVSESFRTKGLVREMDTEQRKGILSREKREGDTESEQRAVRAACVKKREREREEANWSAWAANKYINSNN